MPGTVRCLISQVCEISGVQYVKCGICQAMSYVRFVICQVCDILGKCWICQAKSYLRCLICQE